MRRLLFALLVPATAIAAEAPSLPTGGAHEVVHVPPSPFPIRGPRFAKVTLDVFVAFGHGPSAVGAELARRAVERAHRKDVRAVFHLAPVGPMSNSAGSQLAAEAVLEAAAQEKIWPLVDRLARERNLQLNAVELRRAAVEAGLDGARLQAALEDHRHAPTVERLLRDAQTRGRAGGELLVNGRRSSVWTSDEGLGTTIDEARRRADAMLEAGVPLSRLYDELLAADEAPAPRERESTPPKKRRLSLDLSRAPGRGPSLAPVTIVVFSNFACVACAELADSVRRVRAAHPGLVREVWRNFVPAYSSAGGLDWVGGEIALAAADQGRFWELHDRLQRERPSSVRRSKAQMELLARAAGVDLSKMSLNSARDRLDRERFEAASLGIPYAPSMLVNGLLHSGPMTYERLEKLVRAELDRGILDRLQSP